MDIPNNMLPTHSLRLDYAIATHFVKAARGTTAAMILDPDYWANLAWKFEPFHVVHVVTEDFTLDAELRVVDVDARKLWARMYVLRLQEMPEAVDEVKVATDPDGYEVEWGGPAHRWRILRGDKVIEHSLPTKEAAVARVAEVKAEKVAA